MGLDIHDALRYIVSVPKKKPAGPRVIRRYENRKLYDTLGRRYVTLQGLARMVGAGEDVRVVDQKTGDDLTTLMLAQVVMEGVRAHSWRIPAQALAGLIRRGGQAASAAWVSPQEAARRARQETERIVGRLLGRLSLEEALALRQDVAAAVQRIVAEAQQGLEERARGLLDRLEGRSRARRARPARKPKKSKKPLNRRKTR